MTGENDGRVAVVTGGSQGIGHAIALGLAHQGAAVVVHGYTLDLAEEVAEEIRGRGGRAAAASGPIDDPATSQSCVGIATTEFGRLDTLVTCAGVQRYGDAVATSEETWDEVFDVNVKGVFLTVHAALPHLRTSPAGSVVIISSAQATATQNQVVAYTASKGALVALARALAVDEAEYGIRVNSVSPGSVDTPMLRASAALFGDGSARAPRQSSQTGARRIPWAAWRRLRRSGRSCHSSPAPGRASSPAPTFVWTAGCSRGSRRPSRNQRGSSPTGRSLSYVRSSIAESRSTCSS